MNKLEALRKQGIELSKNELRKIKGGRSWFYCMTHSIDIVVFGITIVDGPVGDNGYTWEDCRASSK